MWAWEQVVYQLCGVALHIFAAATQRHAPCDARDCADEILMNAMSADPGTAQSAKLGKSAKAIKAVRALKIGKVIRLLKVRLEC